VADGGSFDGGDDVAQAANRQTVSMEAQALAYRKECVLGMRDCTKTTRWLEAPLSAAEHTAGVRITLAAARRSAHLRWYNQQPSETWRPVHWTVE